MAICRVIDGIPRDIEVSILSIEPVKMEREMIATGIYLERLEVSSETEL